MNVKGQTGVVMCSGLSSIMRVAWSRPRPNQFLSAVSLLCCRYQVRGYKHHKHKKAEARLNFYTVLGVSPKATQSQIKGAYYKLSKIYHPDVNQGSKAAQDRFAAISEAYSVLGNVKLRRRYDRGIFSERDLHSENKEKVSHQEKDSSRKYSVYYNTHGERMFDFDEFYKAHYGEARLREQREREARKQRSEEWRKIW
ncbi:dnaJ homolog subfamily C member 30-like isoform X2 [Acanthaster planci]|uniref:DnaJ homolog subfamily C member 30-like isoform X2 n=1 Tax=Acanthaster planci TaxID=133434 RepID=A0A8B7YPC8_ACAPL|nr:dnaJ homolog subfamily C member 30-like isoform X2 [Acanthaster planci]